MDKPYIEILYFSDPTTLWEAKLPWQAEMTVATAIAQSGLEQVFPNLDYQHLGLGVFGQKATFTQVLSPFDRVEICRPLVFDPMQSRRRRAAHKQKQRKQPAPVRKLKKVREATDDARASSFRRIQP